MVSQLEIISPVVDHVYNQRVINVKGKIPFEVLDRVENVVITQPNVSGTRNVASISGDEFTGKAVISLGNNSITIVGLDENGQEVTLPVTVPFVGVEHSNPTAVNALVKSNMVYVLSWDTNSTDLDLYVSDPQNRTIWYGNRSISGVGRQNVDDVNGFGPEVTTFFYDENASEGNYEVNVNYYSGSPDTYYTVDVLLNEGNSPETVGYRYVAENPLTSASHGQGFPPYSTSSSWGADVFRIHCRGTGAEQVCGKQ